MSEISLLDSIREFSRLMRIFTMGSKLKMWVMWVAGHQAEWRQALKERVGKGVSVSKIVLNELYDNPEKQELVITVCLAIVLAILIFGGACFAK